MASQNLIKTAELLGPTRSQILEALLEGDLTVPHLSKQLRLIEPGVRKHLAEMERMGIVLSFFSQRGVGRPKKIYTITPAGRSLFPKMYDRVLVSLIAKLGAVTEDGGGKLSERLLREVASDLSKEFHERVKGLSHDERLHEFEKFLNELGFSAKLKKGEDGSVSIIRNDCALYNVAIHNFGIVCVGFDSLLVAKCLDAVGNVKLEGCMALGKSRCEHLISLKH
jgi:predicted ArsR family transcriptional regulator